MIERLSIHHFRNLGQVNLSLARCNLVVGENGSGKTSLLESVFLLSRGRSFRHHEPRRYISHHKDNCVVWASTNFGETASIAIKKQLDTQGKSDTQIRMNQLPLPSQSALSFHLPTLLIDPSSMSLLDEGSSNRRQLIDWLAFHVKPDFYQAWLNYQRLLKQRNSLLKQRGIRQRLAELTAWDGQLSLYAEQIDVCRRQVFDQWQLHFANMLGKLLPDYQDKLHLSYHAGFDSSQSLQAILSARTMADIELGYTRVGAHRADVLVLMTMSAADEAAQTEAATHILSRGEKKLLITALRLSQLTLVCEMITQQSDQPAAVTHPINPPTVLIDDIDAELDAQAIDVLLDAVLSLPCQIIITSLHDDLHAVIQQKLKNQLQQLLLNTTTDLPAVAMNSYQMFHVKQGEFVAV